MRSAQKVLDEKYLGEIFEVIARGATKDELAQGLVTMHREIVKVRKTIQEELYWLDLVYQSIFSSIGNDESSEVTK